MNNSKDQANAIILFDGVCNFCNASVNFIIRHDHTNYFRFSPLQSTAGQKLVQHFKMEHLPLNSILLVENNMIYQKSTAVLRISKKLSGAYFLLYGFIIIPPFIRDAIYTYVARNRYKWFGKKETCMIPTTEIKEKFIF